jgi:glucan phosphoethanolaminetransferase (alkaline phosphatase superfamily)
LFPILEVVLIVVIVVLMIVLILETRQYFKLKRSSESLTKLVNDYEGNFNSIVSSLTTINAFIESATEEHQEIAKQLIAIGVVLELHDKALNLTALRLLTDPEIKPL